MGVFKIMLTVKTGKNFILTQKVGKKETQAINDKACSSYILSMLSLKDNSSKLT